MFQDLRFDTLICDVPRPRVARITLNRPQAMNAYTFALCGELQAAIAAFRDEDELTVLILTGAGNRAFCTGGDIGGSDEALDDQRPRVVGVKDVVLQVQRALGELDQQPPGHEGVEARGQQPKSGAAAALGGARGDPAFESSQGPGRFAS